MLEEFRREELAVAVNRMRFNIGWENPLANFGSPASKVDLIEYFVTRVYEWNDAQASASLRKINETSILIENPNVVRPAIVLGLLPLPMLEQVALKLNIDTSTKISRGGLWGGIKRKLGESFKDDPKLWHIVLKMAEQIAEPGIPSPMEYQHYSSLCPTCEKESPDGADHCIHCGLLLPLNVCPNCQTRNVKAAKFCMGCGQVR